MGKNLILYLCNGKMCGKDTLYCKKRHRKNWLCEHTTNNKFAINEKCDDPWNHPERFDREYNKETRTTYWVEKEE